MSCCEASSVPLGLLHSKKVEDGFRSMIRRGYFETYDKDTSTPTQPYRKFVRQVEQFTARELSYEKDSLNAFIRGLNYYKGGQGPESFPLYTHMGLPCNSEPSNAMDAYAYTPQLLRSLIWRHEASLNRKPPSRRQGYPSYSWAGWAGVATLSNEPMTWHERFVIMIHKTRDPETASDLFAPLGVTLDVEAYIFQAYVNFYEDLDSNGIHTSFHLTHQKTWTMGKDNPYYFLMTS